MPHERDSLREQLMLAKRNLSRQLEVLQSPTTLAGNPGLRPPDNRTVIAKLQAQLREIDEALVSLGSDGG